MKKKVFFYIITILIFGIISFRIVDLSIFKHEYYLKRLNDKTNIYVTSSSAPRGRILDRNGKVIVDNKGVKTINYTKLKGITSLEEIEIAKKIASIANVSSGSIENLKEYWLVLNKNGKDLITNEEYQLLQERKLTTSDLKRLKLERIDESFFSDYSDVDKKASFIYSLMNKGYNYEKKEILRNPSEEEYARIIESNIPGITDEMSWERIYNYGDTLKSILGRIGRIPEEEKDAYLKKGYELNDLVGISYLESYYEDYLKGKKAVFLVNKDNTLTKISEEEKGSDIVLAIDIDIEEKLNEIIKEKILLGKTRANTEYYHDSFGIVSNPLTGEIIALSGVRLNDDNSFSDITSNIINTSYTIGSAVKGATIAVGYNNNLITMGKKITDSCVKLYSVPAKCSHKRLGLIDDVDALAQSSNYFQYLVAINLVGKKYTSNMKLGATKKEFDIYRNTLANFGLGVKTGIDLPNEKSGIIGTNYADDLLLNLAIGQYDTYTPIEMIQYINSIASGYRMSPRIMKQIVNNDEVLVKDEVKILNKIAVDDIYLDRIRLGMEKVLSVGTGRIYVSNKINGVGKTGTSESFYDSNFDGKADVATITSTFAGYFPKDNPKYSVVVITPNISHKNGKNDSFYLGASKITRDITDFLFENY